MEHETILGYPVGSLGIHDYVSMIRRFLDHSGQVRYLACANPHSLMVAERDPLFQQALMAADLLIPDGIGILIASRLLKARIRQRVTGSDMLREVSGLLDKRGGRVFFLGASEATLQAIVAGMKVKYPHIREIGTFSPPFREVFTGAENKAMIDRVNAFRPDVLWVGMTAPKQEKWIYFNRDRLEVPFVGAIGAAFDFFAGTKKRSSARWQSLGLEWLPRFIKEPRRLWERNLKSNPLFLLRVLSDPAAKAQRILFPAQRT